jgi:hypothetical protein
VTVPQDPDEQVGRMNRTCFSDARGMLEKKIKIVTLLGLSLKNKRKFKMSQCRYKICKGISDL